MPKFLHEGQAMPELHVRSGIAGLPVAARDESLVVQRRALNFDGR
jgi:hypothetical protein